MKLEVISRLPDGPAHKTPLLFIHGSWHAAWCWDVHFLDYFARHGYAAYALSLQGHGASEGHAQLRCTSMSQFVDNVASVARDLPAPPVVIGHSLGGLVAQYYLAKHSGPAGVFLASAPPQGMLRNMIRLAVNAPLAFLKAAVTLFMYFLVETPALARQWLFTPDLPEEKVVAYWRLLGNESARAFMESLIIPASRQPRTTAPVLVLADELDAVFYQDQFHATARHYGTKAEIIPGMAHDMMLEPQWERAAERILAWLNQTLGVPPVATAAPPQPPPPAVS
ncbi:alpha/beta hydrolase [Azospirillum sp. B4]|uniref:alpha/beta hydrolase n=1 Tax=Azospirillum sp. B4 TaxID=95605 RepID=UPI00034AA08F|nr:alpha/beta fold hydrolase [Azospirillum sp. B4]